MPVVEKRGDRFRLRCQRCTPVKSFTADSESACLDSYSAHLKSHEAAPAAEAVTAPERQADTVADLIERYCREILPLHKAGQNEAYALNAMLRVSPLATRPANSITRKDFQQWLDTRMRDAVKPSTVRIGLALWRQVFRTGIMREWCGLSFTQVNPTSDLHLPKAMSSYRSERKRLPKGDEWERLQRAFLYRCMVGYRYGEKPPGQGGIYRPMAYYIMVFARLSGMRKSEILKLKVSDINGKLATLTDTKNGEDQVRPLTTAARQFLDDYMAEHPAKPSDKLFPWHGTVNHLSVEFGRVRKRAGVIGLQLRDLRADFATTTFKALNRDALTAARYTGHRDITVFARHYNRMTDEEVSELL